MVANANACRFYRAYGTALELWRDSRPEVILSGPAGTGKSRACLEKLHACCLRWPKTRALIVRKTRESLSESALVTFEAKVLPEGSPIAEGPQRRMRQAYRYPNGSEVIVGGLDKPSKVMSTEYDLIYIQEAIELHENDLESLTTRLRNGVMPFQQLIGDTNPDSPQHWLYQRMMRGQTVMLESRHEDNPELWDRDKGEWTPKGIAYIGKLDNLTGARKPRLRHGKWVQAEGVVYEDWDRSVHLIDRFEIPESWRRFRSIDFGYTNPFVCQWWAIDHDWRMYLYREIYRTKRIVADHAAHIAKLEKWFLPDGKTPNPKRERIDFTVADHDAEDRATLRRAGIFTHPAKKSIKPGIEEIQKRLRVQDDGKARIYLFRDALVERDESLSEAKLPCSTAEEFDGYIWPKGQDGKAVKEEPVDRDNHGMDAMRYGGMDASPCGAPIGPEQEAERKTEAEAKQKQEQDEWLNPMNPALWR